MQLLHRFFFVQGFSGAVPDGPSGARVAARAWGRSCGGVRLAEGAASSRADAFKKIAFTALPD